MRIALYGATGYAGMEALRIMLQRTDLEIVWIGSDTHADHPLAEVCAQFRGASIASLRYAAMRTLEEPPDADVALLALPHGEAHRHVPDLLAKGVRVVDFSGDYRLPPALYEQWYKRPAAAAETPAVYGLPEMFRDDIRSAGLVANPGCHATAAELALLPLAEMGWLDGQRVAVDAKSGVSGAGRSPQLTTHFVEIGGNFTAYRVGQHQHTPEIEQTLAQASRRRRRTNAGASTPSAATMTMAMDAAAMDGQGAGAVKILLTTQLMPVARGIYATAYAPAPSDMNTDDLYEIYRNRYENEPFVDVLPPGQMPELRNVAGTNLCQIGLFVDDRTRTILAVAALDNLGKGAAGQALQNVNIMLNLPDDYGLAATAWR
ncbi:MAG: N-acetyl-gamma-glutamyl-phosphate reductase [Bacilli bacterium]